MSTYSTIIQDPQIRALVQENTLLRKWHDALIPGTLFRADAKAEVFGLNLGETRLMTGNAIIKPKMKPLQPGQDPSPSTYTSEQWQATPAKYADSIDTDLPTSAMALADLLFRNMDTLGATAATSINLVCRDTEYAAALSGATFAESSLGGSGTQSLGSGGTATLRVRYINGFTTARTPAAAGTNAVRFESVSASNPLAIKVTTTAGVLDANVVGYTPDNNGDTRGPGVLNITYASGTAYTVASRAAVLSYDRTYMVRVGGGATCDAVTTSNTFTLAAARQAIARLQSQNVKPIGMDGTFHCHMDPYSQAQIFSDPEFQRLNTSLPDGQWYSQYVMARLMGTSWIQNTACPAQGTVVLSGGNFYDPDDPIPVILQNASGVNLSHPLFIGDEALYEYYIPLDAVLSTPAGFTGVVQNQNPVVYSDISLNAAGIKFITRAPLNRIQDQISCSYLYQGDFVVRTDSTSGDNARYKRVCAVEHAGPA